MISYAGQMSISVEFPTVAGLSLCSFRRLTVRGSPVLGYENDRVSLVVSIHDGY